MTDRGPLQNPGQAAIFADPTEARARALALLVNPQSSPEERAGALSVLGHAAYYANKMDEAVRYLEEASSVVTAPSLALDISITLAPALSKLGRNDEALAALEIDEADLSAGQIGTIQNHRGLIHVASGRMPDALANFKAALENQRIAGDPFKAARALVNMGAVASEMGDLDLAEQHYEEAWTLSSDTGQDVATATIEGNLGYVASRRGDFGAAVEWYERGRASFGAIGDVDLLVAVLEADYATTLLDVGLNVRALEAAELARLSATAGGNRMLDMQALSLSGEAQLRLGMYEQAEKSLTEVRKLARDLDLGAWVLRADYLLLSLHSTRPDESPPPPDAVIELAEGMRDAGWHREALRSLVRGARALHLQGRNADALATLGRVKSLDLDRADPIDRAHSDALTALLQDRPEDVARAIQRGFEEVTRQRMLVGSAELEVRLGHKLNELIDLALEGPITAGDARGVVRERERGARRPERTRDASSVDLRAEMRDVRVSMQEARLAGEDTTEIEGRILSLTDRAEMHSPDLHASLALSPPQPHVVIRYVEHRGELWAVCLEENAVRLVGLGAVAPIRSAVRAQRLALSRMAAGETTPQFEAVSKRLSELLCDPLGLRDGPQIVLVPDHPIANVAWSALPPLRHRAFGLAPTLQDLASEVGGIAVNSVAVLGGPGLTLSQPEVERVGRMWGEQPIRIANATASEAQTAFASSDLVHVATHGTFRPDNPFFTSLRFDDRSITLLDLEGTKVPQAVVLGSCATAASGSVGTELVGTAATFVTLGSRAVIAPVVVVDDAAAHRSVCDIHRSLVSGRSPTEAVLEARRSALDRGSPADVSSASAFQVIGTSAIAEPLQISCI